MLLFSGLKLINAQTYGIINICYNETGVISADNPLTCNQIQWSTATSLLNGIGATLPISFNHTNTSSPYYIADGDSINVYCAGTGIIDTIVIAHLIHKPEICLVSGDPVSGGLIIAIDSATMVGYDTAYVQRETAGVFNTIGMIVKQDSLTFTDTGADFTTQAFTYQLISSYCEESEPHTSIHLQTNGRNLNWTSYVGLTNLTGFYIWRKNPGDTVWSQIGTTSNISNTSYTDNSVTYQDSSEFIVEALRNEGCNTNVWKTNDTQFASGSIRSNKALSTLTGISATTADKKIKMINPSDGLHLTCENPVDVIVSSITTGQIINYTKNITALNLDLMPGIYSVDIRNGNYRTVRKLVVIK